MQLPELLRALRHLGLSGMAASLEARLVQAQADQLAPADFLALLLQDELTRRADRLLARRLKEAQFRDPDKTLDGFDFDFNKKMDRRLVFDLATGRFVTQRDDVVCLGPPGTGKSHLAQALGRPSSYQGHRVLHREVHVLLSGPQRRTWAWWRRRSRSAPTAATSPSSLPQSSTGRFEVEHGADPLIPPHDQLEEIFCGGGGELAHPQVVQNQERHGGELLQALAPRAGERGVGEFLGSWRMKEHASRQATEAPGEAKNETISVMSG